MNQKATFASIVALAAVFVGVALYAGKKRSEASARADAFRIKAASLKSEMAALEKSIAAANQAREKAAAILKSRPPVRTAPSRELPATSSLNDRLMHDPKLEALSLAVQRARLVYSYGPLFQELHLSSEQIAKLEDIIAEHTGQIADIQMTAKSEGLPQSDPAIQALRQQADQQLQTAEQAFLGDNGYQQAQAYDRTLPVRALVDWLAGAVAFTDPISKQQGEQLTQALANGSPSYQNGGKADMADVDYEQLDQVTQGILSPAQLAVWQQTAPAEGSSRAFAQIMGAIKKAQAAPNNAGNGP